MSEERVDVGEQNVANLLKHSYQPEGPEADFAARMKARLREESTKQAAPATISVGQRLAWVVGLAALLAGLSFPLRWMLEPDPKTPPKGDIEERVFEGLTAKARPPLPALEKAAVGEVLSTKTAERRRLALPDGSILFLNENTRVRVGERQQLELETGEIYIETAEDAEADSHLVVRTGQRELISLGTRFSVRAGNDEGVLVTQGKVGIDSTKRLVLAGQQWLASNDEITVASRYSHLLDWTRDLMVAAESPLVPGSKYAGGALIAVDPEGQEAKLSLRRYHVDVHIEDGFARTTIDQTYFNHQPWRLEGTFFFPLPPDASLSRLAMYVDNGKGRAVLNEGGMAERNYARGVYDQIVYSQRDPALLEWLDGSTFKMRVFPLEGRQEKRIILSYTQRLETLFGKEHYRFPAGHNLQVIRDWSFKARIKKAAGLQWNSPSHKLDAARRDGDLYLSAHARNIKANKDVVVDVFPAAGGANAGQGAEATRLSSARHDGNDYLMLRYRPEIPSREVKPTRAPRHWIFLCESSGDRDPLVARVQVEIVRSLLEQVEHDDTFALVTANTRTRSFNRQGKAIFPAAPANIKQGIRFLEQSHLVGALDLGQAIGVIKELKQGERDNYLVHVGSGVASLGERREDELARHLPEDVHYVGVGVGKRWARSFMKNAAERSAGFFTQINPDEPIAWRAFELFSSLNTPRLLDVKVSDPEERRYLKFSSSLSQGEELCAVTRLEAGVPMPDTLTVTGSIDGKPYRKTIPVKKADVKPEAYCLPRLWAKMEIDRLLAEDSVQHRERIIELSKAMYVMTPFTSLLVLENDEMYEQFKVDRGRKDHWALYNCPPTIPIVFEPDPAHPGVGPNRKKKPRNVQEVLNTIVTRSQLNILNGWSTEAAEELESFYEGIEGAPVRLGQVFLVGDDVTRNNVLRQFEPKVIRYFAEDQLVAQREALTGSMRLAGGERRGYAAHPIAHDPPMGFTSAHQDLSKQNTLGYLDHRFEVIAGKKLKQLEKLDRLIEASDKALERAWVEELLTPYSRSCRLYSRPGFNGEQRLAYDLLAQAPGLNTSGADIEAVVDAEAETKTRTLPGRVEPAARKLIERARQVGWRTLTYPGKSLRITFDGQGRYVSKQTLPFGLEETVICDGDTIWHLYPELGLAAKRNVSRFHRFELAKRLPWAMPTADDLAIGHDVTVLGADTIMVAPRDVVNQKDKAGKPLPYLCFHLVFGNDGSLTERRLVRHNADGKEEVLARSTYGSAGVVKSFDEKDSEVASRAGGLEAAKAPALEPETGELVVLPMPYRTSQHVRNVVDFRNYEQLERTEALALLAAAVGQRSGSEALRVYRECFHERGDRRLGFYTLLASCGVNVDPTRMREEVMRGNEAPLTLPRIGYQRPHAESVLIEHADKPLARYLAYFSDRNARQRATGSPRFEGGLLEKLSTFHALQRSWMTGRAGKGLQTAADRDAAFGFIAANKNILGWALLSIVTHHDDDRLQQAEAYQQFADMPTLGYHARYEQACSLLKTDRADEGRRLLARLYAETLPNELPAMDGRFVEAFEKDQPFTKTARKLCGEGRRLEAVALAWQLRRLGQDERGSELVAIALDDLDKPVERLAVTLAAASYFEDRGDRARAEALIKPLLADKELSKLAFLWHRAANLAAQRENREEVIPYLEKALTMEFKHGPDIVDLRSVRKDYGRLLGYYLELARAMRALNVDVPEDFAARVVRTADQWRALDRDKGDDACQSAARILRLIGARDLAWDYLTTPVALHPSESDPWMGMARMLASEAEYALADQAYEAAFQADPTNAQLLWDRAQNLEQGGRHKEARAVYQRIAAGDWQPRFHWMRDRARQRLN